MERAYERALYAVSEASRKAVEEETHAKIREILAHRGVEPGPNESLMEAFARALGLTPWELRARLAQQRS
ncbi:MAG TPA: hypothetical protein VIY49_09495 [Bryobacteraceae bacterium]